MEHQEEKGNCQNCKQDFIIEPEDFKFYEKIKVPPPTWCAECRLIRRMVWRNERSLYKRKCDLCKKDIFSMYPARTPFPVYCHDCWWGDGWDPLSYGRDYDWNKSFFDQFNKLYNSVPKVSLIHYPPNENVTYSNMVRGGKNIYLSYSISALGSAGCENIFYSYSVDSCRNCFDCSILQKSENCYANIEGFQNYNSPFLKRTHDCMDSAFLFDCVNCRNCFMSSNLRNGRYVFKNQQLTKESYEKKMKNVDFGSHRNLEGFKNEFSDLIENSIHKFANTAKVINCTGDDIFNSKNTEKCFNVRDMINCKYIIRAFDMKDSMDIFVNGGGELNYEAISAGHNSFKFLFSMFGYSDSKDISYSGGTSNCSNLFGCISLRKKQYCILNKQYSQEEYKDLIPKIIKHMNDMPYKDRLGHIYKYGDFFPSEFSPWSYNETVAQEFFPKNAEKAAEFGYNWETKEKKHLQATVIPETLPDHINDVDDSILKEIIGCMHKGKCHEQCTNVFKVVRAELDFYRKMNLPLPRLCPNCRHYERLKQRNPLKLWHRSCMCDKINHPAHSNTQCSNKFETPYDPDRPEKVYCEQCYQMEIY